jgi:hypothetical protein
MFLCGCLENHEKLEILLFTCKLYITRAYAGLYLYTNTQD